MTELEALRTFVERVRDALKHRGKPLRHGVGPVATCEAIASALEDFDEDLKVDE